MANDKRITVRLSDEEHAKVENEAASNGISMGEYIRLKLGADKKIEVKKTFEKIEIIIQTEDLEELLVDARELLIKVNRICNTAIQTGETYPQDIKKVQLTLDELVKLMNEKRIDTFTTRKEIRSEARKILKEKGVI